MSLISSPGLVLRRVRHLENDLRLTLLLRDVGKVIAVAKGGQRLKAKLKAVQEPFAEADFQIFLPAQGVRARLTGGKLIDSHMGLRRSVAAFEVGFRCCEVVEMMLPLRAPAPEVYGVLRHTLRSLHKAVPPRVEWVLFVIRLLNCLGHGDLRNDLLAAVSVADRPALASLLELEEDAGAPFSLGDESLAAAESFVQERLEPLLPWPLKSETASVLISPR